MSPLRPEEKEKEKGGEQGTHGDLFLVLGWWSKDSGPTQHVTSELVETGNQDKIFAAATHPCLLPYNGDQAKSYWWVIQGVSCQLGSSDETTALWRFLQKLQNGAVMSHFAKTQWGPNGKTYAKFLMHGGFSKNGHHYQTLSFHYYLVPIQFLLFLYTSIKTTTCLTFKII